MPLDQPDEDEFAEEPGEERSLARMPLTDHLEELRHRLIMCLVGPLVAAVFTLAVGWSLVHWITRPLLQVQQILGMPPQTYAFGVTTGFGVYLKVSLVAAIIIAFPWICYQIWKFVESGLYPHERKGIVLVLPFSAIMSVLGVLFLYYLLLPACLAFMLFFNSSFPAPTLTDRSSGGWLETFIQITVSSYGMDSSAIGGDAKSDPDNKSDGNQGSTDNDNKSDDQKTNGGESSNQDAGDSDNKDDTNTTDDGKSEQNGNASNAEGGGNGDEPANGTPNPADAHSGSAQPVRTWPRLRTNPDDPVDGQYWIKMPEGELRYYLDGRVRRVVPMQTNSMLGTLMDINQYLSFVTLLALGVVIAFQLPVVLLILGWSGLVSPHFLARYRKHCIFACFGVGAVFTPADPMSMMVLALPLWGLFEFGLLLMRLTYRQPEPEMMD